jgi:hypothetical protein
MPLTEPFSLPTCDATGLPGGIDIRTAGGSRDYSNTGIVGPLPPGDYGHVAFGSGNLVEFEGGDYSFLSLQFGGNTAVEVLAPMTVRVQGELRFGSGVEMGLASGVEAPDIIFLVDGIANGDPVHQSGGNTVIYGTICGPQSSISIGSGSQVEGALIGKEIRFGGNVSFTARPAPSVFAQ